MQGAFLLEKVVVELPQSLYFRALPSTSAKYFFNARGLSIWKGCYKEVEEKIAKISVLPEVWPVTPMLLPIIVCTLTSQ